MLQLDIIRTTDTTFPNDQALSEWAQAAYLAQETVSLAIKIVDKVESKKLNGQFRGRDYPTNVLSFPMQMPSLEPVRILGDIAICDEVVIEEAAQQSKTVPAHWAHMVIHGVLHLQGYDHIDDDSAREMENIEVMILAKMGFANPY